MIYSKKARIKNLFIILLVGVILFHPSFYYSVSANEADDASDNTEQSSVEEPQTVIDEPVVEEASGEGGSVLSESGRDSTENSEPVEEQTNEEDDGSIELDTGNADAGVDINNQTNINETDLSSATEDNEELSQEEDLTDEEGLSSGEGDEALPEEEVVNEENQEDASDEENNSCLLDSVEDQDNQGFNVTSTDEIIDNNNVGESCLAPYEEPENNGENSDSGNNATSTDDLILEADSEDDNATTTDEALGNEPQNNGSQGDNATSTDEVVLGEENNGDEEVIEEDLPEDNSSEGDNTEDSLCVLPADEDGLGVDSLEPESDDESDGLTGNSTSTDSVIGIENNNNANICNNVGVAADTGDNEAGQNDGDVTITTGDVEVTVDIFDQANMNIAVLPDTCDDCDENGENIEDSIQDGGNGEDSGGFESDAVPPPPSSSGGPGGGLIIIENNNNAFVGSDVDIYGSSGSNSATSTAGSAVIDTGDVEVVANVINVVNTNVTGSDIWDMVLFFSENLTADLDFDWGNSPESNCPSESCYNSINVENNNKATVNNNVDVLASSGFNTASANSGFAGIETGDVKVVVNLVNFVNTNITGSNWVLAIINIFGDWVGDLVLPGHDSIAQYMDVSGSATTTSGVLSQNTVINNENSADVSNSIDNVALSGANETSENSGDSLIQTGSADAKSNVMTYANMNAFGSNWFLSSFNIFGDWQGNVFSRPDGISIKDFGNGSFNLYSENADPNSVANGDGQVLLEEGSGNSQEISNTNDASISNNVSVYAETGSNQASYNSGNGIVSTGNAEVMTNVFNFLNTNITGGNWFLGAFNIFGDWEGDIAFGRPDLDVSVDTVAVEDVPAPPGSVIDYTISYSNNGNAPATGVMIRDDYNESLIAPSGDNGGEDNAGALEWYIGDIPVGGSGTITYSMTVNSDLNSVETASNAILINEFEDDADYTDNSASYSVDVGSVFTKSSPIIIEEPLYNPIPVPKLTVDKTNDAGELVYPGDIVNYTITITNEGTAPVSDAVLEDVLKNGEELSTAYQYIGNIEAGETVIIEYSLEIPLDAQSGVYTNTARVSGIFWGVEFYSIFPASSSITVVGSSAVGGDKDEALSEEDNNEIIKLADSGDNSNAEVANTISDKGFKAFNQSVTHEEEEEGISENDEQQEINEQQSPANLGLMAALSGFLTGRNLLYLLLILIAIIILLILLKRRKKNE